MNLRIMNNAFKTILISIAVFGGGFLAASPVNAVAGSLVVQFEQTPLFNEANFLPGEVISRWIRVTNNGEQTQRIATETINVNDPNRLSNGLNLKIKEGGTTLYDNSLSQFFADGEVYLSSLGGGGTQTQYDLTVSFASESGNPLQGKTLGFDIIIGFEGAVGGLPLGGGGGGGGGGLPPGLTIEEESVRVTTTTEMSATITWTTSYLSTSQVVYGAEGERHALDLADATGTPPHYGYSHTTPEYDISPRVTFHSVTVFGLTPNTTYYFRAISHASLAVSREYRFTTLTAGAIENVLLESVTEGGTGGTPVGTVGGAPSPMVGIPAGGAGTSSAPGGGGLAGETVPPENKVPIGLASMLAFGLATMWGMISKSTFLLILVILCLMALILLIVGERGRRQEERKKNTMGNPPDPPSSVSTY